MAEWQRYSVTKISEGTNRHGSAHNRGASGFPLVYTKLEGTNQWIKVLSNFCKYVYYIIKFASVVKTDIFLQFKVSDIAVSDHSPEFIKKATKRNKYGK